MEEPHSAAINALTEKIGADLDEETMAALATQFDTQDDLVEPLFDLPEPEPPERSWEEATAEDDPLGAFLTRCSVGGTEGPLSDLRIGVKDNIAVAGVPMTCGSPLLEGYRPSTDATVVSRLLDAGSEIVGKTNMDEFAFGGDESTMRLRLARNPHDEAHQPGSSSAGSGVAVATGEVDAALGSDTGGSVRFPAAWCGVTGLKPTRGAVSHHGFVQYAKTLDNVGILGRDVSTVARVFGAIAGADPADERTAGSHAGADLDDVTDTDPEDLVIGRPAELFGNAPALDEVVEARLDDLVDAGATVRDVTIPTYDLWLPSWFTIGMTEFSRYLDARGANTWALSPGLPGLADALSEALADPEALGAPVLSAWLYGHRLVDELGNRAYPRAQQARERLADGVDDSLSEVDVLASTTVPLLPPAWGEGIDDVFGALSNTGPFNVTGHPALSVPAGTIDGLPVGLQFVGRHGDETAVLGAGHAATAGLAEP
jgi:amidase/aspartyl-tRNA(Asn)/glutamyl-tRNA(Gln) amidotransferase subunit A